MERELRRLLENKADEMSLPLMMPDTLGARLRRRRLLTVAVGAVLVVALVSGSAAAVSGFWAPDRNADEDDVAPELTELPEDDFDLYTMTIRGKEVQQVTGTPENELYPAWSPVANLVAFSRVSRFGPGHIFVTNGEVEVRVTSGEAVVDEAPAWSPDGESIAFTRFYQGSEEARIFIVNVDNLYNADGTAYEEERPLRRLIKEPHGFLERWPTWSPDGREIAFVGDDTVYTVRADGTGMQARYQVRGGVERIAWNRATGDLLVTPHRPVDHFRELTLAGELGPRIGPPHIPQRFPAWSPDGRLIAFMISDVEDNEIFTIRPDGSRRTRLTDNLHDDLYPSFSPNGGYLVFSSNRKGA